MKESLDVFISYAHEDELLKKNLEKHLALLRNLGFITPWHDRNISAGTDWKHKINMYLDAADIILLLVSASFLASEFCYSIEMKQAIQRHEDGLARVIPVILRPVDWKSAPFGTLQALPTDGRPVTGRGWQNTDEAFTSIAEGIRKVAEEIGVGLPQQLLGSSHNVPPQHIVPTRLPRPATLVGRDTELATLMAQLRTGKASGICALNGMGGIGKTAIAAEAVARLSEDRKTFPGGAAWIFCEGLAGPKGQNEIFVQVALALGLGQIAASNHSDTRHLELATALREFPRMLIALDNVEPQIDAENLIDVLAVPGHTTLLLTARQAIKPERLTLIRLRPLLTSDGAILFTQRLKQIDSDRPTTDEIVFIPQIISALGGLPLAIELVAAYAGLQYISLNQIIWELGQDNIEANSLNSDPDPERAIVHRFNRSWAVLSPEERRLFASLSLPKETTSLRDTAAALAIAARYGRKKLPKTLQSEITKRAQQDVAKLVAYALIEPMAENRLRLHPLLREYSVSRWRELALEERKDLEYALITFWKESMNDYIQIYSDYEGLSGSEANNLWQTQRHLDKEAFRELGQQTSRNVPTLNMHADKLRQIGFYIGKHGEHDLGKKRILEGLEMSTALKDIEGMGKCFQCLALLDEDEGNYLSAVKYYHEAVRLFEQSRSSELEIVRSRLKLLQKKLESR